MKGDLYYLTLLAGYVTSKASPSDSLNVLLRDKK